MPNLPARLPADNAVNKFVAYIEIGAHLMRRITLKKKEGNIPMTKNGNWT
jgi:hypothetical protein